jgi:hypothetical protein
MTVTQGIFLFCIGALVGVAVIMKIVNMILARSSVTKIEWKREPGKRARLHLHAHVRFANEVRARELDVDVPRSISWDWSFDLHDRYETESHLAVDDDMRPYTEDES